MATNCLPPTAIGTLDHASAWIDNGACPKAEARTLFAMMQRRNESADSIRELIEISPPLEHAFQAYLRDHPEEVGLQQIIAFRQRTLEEFERLTKQASPLIGPS